MGQAGGEGWNAARGRFARNAIIQGAAAELFKAWTAVEELPGTVDPLPAILARTYTEIAEKHGAPQAAEFLLMLVANMGEEDRAVAARVILMSPGRSHTPAAQRCP